MLLASTVLIYNNLNQTQTTKQTDSLQHIWHNEHGFHIMQQTNEWMNETLKTLCFLKNKSYSRSHFFYMYIFTCAMYIHTYTHTNIGGGKVNNSQAGPKSM